MQVNSFIFSGTRADFTANKTLEEFLPNFQDEKTKSEIINQIFLFKESTKMMRCIITMLSLIPTPMRETQVLWPMALKVQ